MMPLHTSRKQEKIPYVTYLLMLIIIGVFIIELRQVDIDKFIHLWSFIPALFITSRKYSYIIVLMSLFIHNSIFQVIVNVWFLKIFGETVEDYLGHLGYLLFYLCGGMVGLFIQYATLTNTSLPVFGSTGAISAVLGFYLVYHWKSSIISWLPLKFFKQTIPLPVWFFLCFWFIFPFLQIVGHLGSVRYDLNGLGWSSLFGGFAFGMAIGLMLRPFLVRK